jgi:hypothetical protein
MPARIGGMRARAAAPQPWHHATVQRRQFNFASPKEYYWCLLFSCQGRAKMTLSLCNSLGPVQRVLSSAYDRYPSPSAPPCLETPDLSDAIGSRPTGHGPVTWLDGCLRPSLVMAKNARSQRRGRLLSGKIFENDIVAESATGHVSAVRTHKSSRGMPNYFRYRCTADRRSVT